eukprot:scaffold238150_cov59-Attheya_sp.AAC.1
MIAIHIAHGRRLQGSDGREDIFSDSPVSARPSRSNSRVPPPYKSNDEHPGRLATPPPPTTPATRLG